MNDAEMNISGDLAGQVTTLQRQVFTLLLALIVVSGTLVAFLGYESYHLGKDIKAINTQVVEPYRQKLPAIQEFVTKLVAYGKAHPDFVPILEKNGVFTTTNAPVKPAAGTPAAPVAPKK
ncbi:MAG TPA: hypothetical protein VFY06_04035 [Verrucomicrobiae bacterium]|nr:hypothetical protein [Verrucomicrobiae bacterium]